VKTEDLAIMAENAQKDACMLTNPRKATHAQVVEIFKAAL
jgi:alcohol dehydrogenase